MLAADYWRRRLERRSRFVYFLRMRVEEVTIHRRPTMNVVLRFLTSLFVLVTVFGCCSYETERINTPRGIAVVENASEPEFYDQSIFDDLISRGVRELPSCGEFDQLDAGAMLGISHGGGGAGEWGGCDGSPRYRMQLSSAEGGLVWEGLNEATSYGVSREETCSSLSGDYRCLPFEYTTYSVPSEFQDAEDNPWVEPEPNQRHVVGVNVYSRYKFADDDSYGDDFREHPEAFEKGEEGGAPVAIIVRTFETTDPDAFNLPWSLRADENGVYRCADVYYGYFVRETY